MCSLRYELLSRVFMEAAGIVAPEKKCLLVVGAGRGDEVLALRWRFKKVVAIEPRYDGVAEEAKPFVIRGDATKMELKDASFDVVYCYHVLEHIPEYDKALSEMRRVLKKGGLLYIGVPNKSRLVGYVLVRENSLKDKIIWNLDDYKARLTGRFENRFGAHAGFTRKELSAILTGHFREVSDITERYYILKYGGNRFVRALAGAPPVAGIIWPSIYFTATKREEA